MPLTLVQARRLCASVNRFEEWLAADQELKNARYDLRVAERTGDVEVWMIDRVRKAEVAEREARAAHDATASESIADIRRPLGA